MQVTPPHDFSELVPASPMTRPEESIRSPVSSWHRLDSRSDLISENCVELDSSLFTHAYRLFSHDDWIIERSDRRVR